MNKDWINKYIESIEKIFNDNNIKSELEDSLINRLKDDIKIHIDIKKRFVESKRLFKKLFIRHILMINYCNISKTAKILGIDRKSLHRIIKYLNIDIESIRSEMLKPSYVIKENIKNTTEETINEYVTNKKDYRNIDYRPLYETIENMNIDRDIIMRENIKLKDALIIFEARYLKLTLDKYNHKTIKDISNIIGISYENLIRKLKKHRIRREQNRHIEHIKYKNDKF